jgi:hypothetical protein
MTILRLVTATAAVLWLAAEAPLAAQGDIICCNQLIAVRGAWATSRRDCVEYMRQSTGNRAQICRALAGAGGSCGPAAGLGPSTDSFLDLLLPGFAHAQAPAMSDCCPDVAAQCAPDACKDDPPATGQVFAKGGLRVRSEPASDAPSAGSMPAGMRLFYTEARRIGGQTWFHLKHPGRTSHYGWASAEDVACWRPEHFPWKPLPPPREPWPPYVPSGGARG